jgi:hypothetical protein
VPTIRFDATPHMIDKSIILRLPEKASVKLPSRGQVAVQGTINGHQFQTVLEPDGNFGHWMRIDRKLQKSAALNAGNSATLDLESVKDWPEPSVPQDLKTALSAAPQKIQAQWKEITPMAGWEWVRWVNATPNPDTRKTGVEVSISKMKSGKRRALLFQPWSMHRPEPIKERQAYRASATNALPRRWRTHPPDEYHSPSPRCAHA